MDGALGLLWLFWAWLMSGRNGAARQTQLPHGYGPPPGQPTSLPQGVLTAQPLPPPWPAVMPSGLPPFPGSGWEYDEPPPQVVQQRAGQLVTQLWNRGKGAYQIEQTAGRWISYQAAIMRSGKRGVVAWRVKRAVAKPPVRAQARPVPGLDPRGGPPIDLPPMVVTSRSPGMPQPRRASTSPAEGQPDRQGFVRTSAPAPGSTRVPLPGGSIDVLNQVNPLRLPVLRQGAGMPPAYPSQDVMLLQQKLAIPADGKFGPGTKKAVVEFQRRRGLTQDGVVGTATWTALFAVRA